MKRMLIALFGIALLAPLSGVPARSNGQAESPPELRAEQLRLARWQFEPVEFAEQSSRISPRDRPCLRGILNYLYLVPELGIVLVPRTDTLDGESLPYERARSVRRFLLAESRRRGSTIAGDRIVIRTDVGPCWQEKRSKALGRVVMLAFLVSDIERGQDWAIRSCEDEEIFRSAPPN